MKQYTNWEDMVTSIKGPNYSYALPELGNSRQIQVNHRSESKLKILKHQENEYT